MPRLLLLLLITVISFMLPLAALSATTNGATLPDIASRSESLLSKQQQHDLGRSWLRNLRSQAPILTDPLIQSWYEHIIWKLLPYSQLSDTRLELVLIDTTDINAFAVPGGIIGLNAGTILNADNVDEVAAVLAHELAHISQQHFARRYSDSSKINRSMLLALLASIAIAATGNANAGIAGIAATQAAAIQSQLSYTRHQEAEADRVGMATLAKAGYNTEAMPGFFEKLLRMERYNGEPLQFLIDHPATESRVADTRARVSHYPRIASHSSEDFLMVRARLKARYLRGDENAERYFLDHYKKQKGKKKLAAAYGLALVYMRSHHPDKAMRLLTQLRHTDANNWWLDLAEAETLMAAREFNKANVKLAKLAKLLPGNYPISTFYAQSLLLSGNAQKASILLQRQLSKRPNDPLLWKLYARSQGALKHQARAHLARGELLFLTGHSKKAKQQMQFALDESKGSFSLHSSIQERLKEIKATEKQKF